MKEISILQLPRIKYKPIKINELCFFVALFFYCFNKIISLSLYDYILPSILWKFIRFIILTLLIIKTFIFDRYGLKWLFFMMGTLSLTLIVSITGGYLFLFITVFLILSANNVEFWRVVRSTVIISIICTLFIVISCFLGILEDYTYSHGFGDTINVAHSYGFKYFSTIGYIAMLISISTIYLAKNIKLRHLLLILILNLLLYKVHTTKLVIFVVIVAELYYYYFVILKRGNLTINTRFFKSIGIIITPCLYIITYVISNGFTNIVPRFTGALRDSLDIRFYNSMIAIKKYGLHLFGTPVVMYGNEAFYYGHAPSGYYIDCGYIYTLVAYGVLFSIVICIIYSTLFYNFAISNNIYAYGWLICMVIACVINDFLISPIYNPLIFLIAKVVSNRSWEISNDG